MGPFLFCLAIQPALLRIGNLVDSLTYMDDIYLVGHSENMKAALRILEEELLKLSLRINFTKSWSHKPVTGLSQWEILVNPNPVVMKVPLELRQQANRTVQEQGSQV